MNINYQLKIRFLTDGITLIALIVTIIVLLILAGVTVATLTGENGLLRKASNAGEKTRQKEAEEKINLKITNVQISKYAEEQRMPTLKELADNFCEDKDFQYVQETSKIASLTKISNENPTSIYAKLKAYPYEFEINSKLQLASIDGIQVANADTTEYVSKSQYDSLLARIVALENANYVTSTELNNKISNISTSNNVPQGNAVSGYTLGNWNVEKIGNRVFISGYVVGSFTEHDSTKVVTDLPKTATNITFPVGYDWCDGYGYINGNGDLYIIPNVTSGNLAPFMNFSYTTSE